MHARSLGRENGKSARLCEAEDQAEGGLSSSEELRTAPRAAPKTPQKAGWAQAAMKSLEGESQGQEPVQEPTMLRGQPAGIPGRIQRSPCFLFLLAACKEAHGEGRTRIHQSCSGGLRPGEGVPGSTRGLSQVKGNAAARLLRGLSATKATQEELSTAPKIVPSITQLMPVSRLYQLVSSCAHIQNLFL